MAILKIRNKETGEMEEVLALRGKDGHTPQKGVDYWTDDDKAEIFEEIQSKIEIPDVSNFITSIPDEYVTDTELTEKGYLTEHQSLTGYATEEYVDNAIANIDIPAGGSWELLSYIETTERVNTISVPFGLEDQNTNYQIMVLVPPTTEDITNVGKCRFYIGKQSFMECVMSSNSSNWGTAFADIASCSSFSVVNSIYGGAGLASPASKQTVWSVPITKGVEFKIVPSTDTTKEFEIGTKIWIWAISKEGEV